MPHSFLHQSAVPVEDHRAGKVGLDPKILLSNLINLLKPYPIIVI